MDLGKNLVAVATAPARIGLAAADAGLDVASTALGLVKRSLGEVGTATSSNSMAHMLGLDDAIARANRLARLMADAGIVRNRAKIEATIANARAADGVDLSELLWSFAPAPRPRPVDAGDIPAFSPESTAMARELKRRGFRFVGPTTAYALMQATGMVDDHLQACWVPPAR
ncbi:DNA-3-methyladenine glycosylase 1 [Mycobacterium talmoniae]|uniref:DNA-3-methyladenine glycosylase 1 n=1 Tax=Mycobacterium talmoniae TaxID=1858794 RepID=A0A2S8BPT4_9MYCO|nr:DNA-3-methyladenine glycosylase 1 [Mycobacterium talmoniae]